MRIAWVLLLGLAACQGQSKATRAASDAAQANMDALRAGTEYDQALRQFETGDLVHALESIESCISRLPAMQKSRLLCARILIEQGDLLAALDALNAVEKVERLEFEAQQEQSEEPLAADEFAPFNSDVPYLRGVVLEQLGRFEEALAAYEAASALLPRRAEFLLARAETLVILGRIAEGRALLDRESGELASHAGFRQALGHISLLQGKTIEARMLFGEESILSPADPGILEDLARAQVSLGEFAQALGTLRRFKSLEPRSDLRRLEALCFVQTRQPVKARAILLELTREESGAADFETWNLLADTALVLGDDRMLRTAADGMLQTGPRRLEGHLSMAMWKRRAGDLEGALTSVRKAKDRAGDSKAPAQLEELLVRDLAAAQAGS